MEWIVALVFIVFIGSFCYVAFKALTHGYKSDKKQVIPPKKRN